ncbi:hypothetical protein I9W82_005143 [Candida metapsilosis]|uniref:Uncharacterized protein n=1 Tax=Candida metapsilosis TaxID=273372 RepID=A0A8H7Z921_9ASCO|nr:hypothetical protein I9W82_005143 [Candida metapsilosis]
MSPSNQNTGKLESETPIDKKRQPSETKTKAPPRMITPTTNINPLSKPNPAQLFDLISKNYESWSQAMAKQFEDEENFSPFPSEDDANTQSNPIFNYNLLEALESASVQAGERVKEISSGGVHDPLNLATSQSDTAPRPIKLPKRRIICPPESLLNNTEIDFIRNKITQAIKQKEGGVLPKGNLFDPGIRLRDDFGNLANNMDSNGDLNHTSIEIEFSPIPECEVHGAEDCDCPIFDEGHTSSRLSSKGISSRHNDDENDDGPSCEFTFEYDSNGRLLPTGNNIEEKLQSMKYADKMKGFQDEFNAIMDEADESQPNLYTANNRSVLIPPISSPSKSLHRKTKVKRRLKREITDPLDDLKSFVKEESQRKLEKLRLRDRDSTTPRNFYGLIPNDKCCLLCQYESVFGMEPRYLVAKKTK